MWILMAIHLGVIRVLCSVERGETAVYKDLLPTL